MNTLATVLLVILIDQPDARACGDAILEYHDMGDVFCIDPAEGASLAPATSMKPKPRPEVKK